MAVTEFSDDLHKRVLAFQRDHGLPQDGRLTTDDWTKLAEVAATATEPAADPAVTAEPVAEPAAVVEPVAEPAAVAEPAVTAEPVAAPVPATAAKPAGLNPADFPVLHDIVTHCQDEANAKAYLLDTTGFDIDEIVGNISAVLEEAGA